MFKCNDCKEMFDTPEIRSENMGEFWGTPAYEQYGVCPICGSDDFDEMKKCPVSGEYMDSSEDYAKGVIEWGEDLFSRMIKHVQDTWQCDYKSAKEFLGDIMERSL